MNRTVQAASNLRATILNTITSRQSSQRSSTERIFTGGDEETGDPLAGATDEHIERIINSSGGPIATVKKYSAELTETNERVTAERNSKVRLVEENRVLRTDLKEKDLEIEDLQRRLATTKRLFERYVGKMQPELGPIPQVQILESPAGPYALGTVVLLRISYMALELTVLQKIQVVQSSLLPMMILYTQRVRP